MDRRILWGQVWLVNLDPTIGSEINKTRPALVVSNDLHNGLLRHITVLPITDKGEKVYSVEVFLPKGTVGLTKDSKIRCHQIRTLDKSRFVRLLGECSADHWPHVSRALKIHLGLASGSGH